MSYLDIDNAPFCDIETKHRDIGNLSYFAFHILSTCRGGKWYLENVGLVKFWQDLEISKAFLTRLEVSSIAKI